MDERFKFIVDVHGNCADVIQVKMADGTPPYAIVVMSEYQNSLEKSLEELKKKVVEKLELLELEKKKLLSIEFAVDYEREAHGFFSIIR